jgi:hypothetical protein
VENSLLFHRSTINRRVGLRPPSPADPAKPVAVSCSAALAAGRPFFELKSFLFGEMFGCLNIPVIFNPPSGHQAGPELLAEVFVDPSIPCDARSGDSLRSA